MTDTPRDDGFVDAGPFRPPAPGRATLVRIGRERVALFDRGGHLVALGDRCPHMGASLAEGRLEGDCVVCPWHGWRFDTDTGRSDSRSGKAATLWEARVERGRLLLRRRSRLPDSLPHPSQEEP